MGKSAGVLGRLYGLTAQEMNFVLKEDGFLAGQPGAYWPTEKSERYAQEQDHSRGTGGSLQYNPSWTTGRWDDEIVSILDISDERRREVRRAVSAARREARASADEDREVEEDSFNSQSAETADRNDALGKVLVALMIASGVGLYKASPHLKRWYVDKAAPGIKKAANKINPRSTDKKEGLEAEGEI